MLWGEGGGDGMLLINEWIHMQIEIQTTIEVIKVWEVSSKYEKLFFILLNVQNSELYSTNAKMAARLCCFCSIISSSFFQSELPLTQDFFEQATLSWNWDKQLVFSNTIFRPWWLPCASRFSSPSIACLLHHPTWWCCSIQFSVNLPVPPFL